MRSLTRPRRRRCSHSGCQRAPPLRCERPASGSKEPAQPGVHGRAALPRTEAVIQHRRGWVCLLHVQHLVGHKGAETVGIERRRHGGDAVALRPPTREPVKQPQHGALDAPPDGELLEHVDDAEKVDLLPVARDDAGAAALRRQLLQPLLLGLWHERRRRAVDAEEQRVVEDVLPVEELAMAQIIAQMRALSRSSRSVVMPMSIHSSRAASSTCPRRCSSGAAPTCSGRAVGGGALEVEGERGRTGKKLRITTK